MEYEGRICRSPMERASYMLPVSVGCSYNKCRFCTLFRHLSFRMLPLEQVKEEIERVRAMGGDPHRVFFGDGNAFVLPTERLLTILSWVREAFPGCREVSMDATVKSILTKSDGELKALAEAGVHDLYLGIECALEDVLETMNKGNTLREAEEAIQRLHRAGIEYDAHIMTGISGRGRGEENAHALADFFNRTKPIRICNFSVFHHKKNDLYPDIASGRYIMASELENLLEERVLLREMSDWPCEYDGLHDNVLVRVRGTLPGDREKMLETIEDGLSRATDDPPKIYD